MDFSARYPLEFEDADYVASDESEPVSMALTEENVGLELELVDTICYMFGLKMHTDDALLKKRLCRGAKSFIVWKMNSSVVTGTSSAGCQQWPTT